MTTVNPAISNLAELSAVEGAPGKLFIGGRWVDSSRDSRLAVFDPATGELLKMIQDATPEDGIRALDAAVAAAADWAATSPRRRSDILRRVFDLIQQEKDEIALLMTLEMGKPLHESMSEVAYGAEFLRWFSEEAVRVSGRYGLNPEGTGRMLVSHAPVGPCFLITPWNFPLAMATRKIGPALAAGCTVVIKPAELTPLTTLYLARLFEEAGLPDGVLNVITTSASGAVSAPIIADPRLRKLSFTGSTQVGKKLMVQATENVLRTSMELGGNAAFLVFEDADLDKAVEGALAAKFRNIGQACTAANRFLVHESVAQEFAARLAERVAAMPIGRGTERGVVIGPLINDSAIRKVDHLVRDAVDRGAHLLTGGVRVTGPGTFYRPTVLANVPHNSTIASEEIFGPVVSIAEFRDEDDAVALANGTPYGLASYLYTEDIERVHRMLERLEVGMVGVNVGVISNAAAPFGGLKQSGIGKEGGLEGIDEYLSTRYALIPR